MNRRYITKQFKEIVQRLRETYPNVNLTTDIIVGFPGETEEEFEKTYKFLEQIKFYKMHVFPYSQRKGTKAAIMPNQVIPEEKERRSKKLIELSDYNEEKYNKQYIGKKVEVLWEEQKENIIKGHTKNYILVECEAEKMNLPQNIENRLEIVKIQKANAHGLKARTM